MQLATAPSTRAAACQALGIAVLCVFASALMISGGAPSALAQSAGQGIAQCPAAIRTIDDTGLARIRIEAGCRRGEKVRAILGSLEYEAQFRADGIAEFAIAMSEPKAQVALLFQDGTSDAIDVSFGALDSALRITLQWDVPVDLDLHVVEPQGVVGGPGDAAMPPPAASRPLIGTRDLTDDARGFGPFQECYVIKDRVQRANAVLVVAIANVSRGRVASGAYCEGGDLARVSYTLIVVDRGQVRRRTYELAPLACGRALDDASYYQRLRF